MSRTVNVTIVLLISMCGALAVLLSPDSYAFVLLTQCMIYAIWALSYNLVYGYMGEISFGHAAYFGVGGYALPLLMTHWALPFPVAVVGATAIAALFAVVIASVIRGTRGIYFAIATFIFAQAIYIIVLKWTAFTGGDNGLPAPRPDWLSSSRNYALFCLALTVVVILCLHRVVNSPAGKVVVATRENEQRARQVGYDTARYRVAMFVISGLFSGLAGALFSALIQFVSPDVLFWQMSGLVIIMTIIGGAHVFIGPAIGALFIVVLQDLTSSLSSSTVSIYGMNVSKVGEHWPLLLGITFYAIIVYEPDGIVGLAQGIRQKLLRILAMRQWLRPE